MVINPSGALQHRNIIDQWRGSNSLVRKLLLLIYNSDSIDEKNNHQKKTLNSTGVVDLFIYLFIYCLIDFNGMLTRLVLFYAQRLKSFFS